MSKAARRRTAIGVASLAALSIFVLGQTAPTLKEVFKKNLEASGGKGKIEEVRNLSFTAGETRCYAASDGDLKLVTGKDPVITEVILVKGDSVRENSFNTLTDLTGLQKSVYQTLGRLYAGVFSLLKFDGQLKYEGLKTYGPEQLHCLSTAPGDVNVSFYLRTDDFSLKRLVFEGHTSEGDIYKVNYDFAPFEESGGCRIPPSWFRSQVGTRGNLVEVSEFKANQPLPEDFFNRLDVNIGTTEAAPGRLKGNVLDFASSRYGLSITTNWTKKDIEKAQLRTGDKIAFLLEGLEAELIFYASGGDVPPQSELARGARLLVPAPRGGETYAVQFIAVDTAQVETKLKRLAPIEIRKK
jgi:hypothetical protein